MKRIEKKKKNRASPKLQQEKSRNRCRRPRDLLHIFRSTETTWRPTTPTFMTAGGQAMLKYEYRGQDNYVSSRCVTAGHQTGMAI